MLLAASPGVAHREAAFYLVAAPQLGQRLELGLQRGGFERVASISSELKPFTLDPGRTAGPCGFALAVRLN